MRHAQTNQGATLKSVYEKPKIEIIRFNGADIITASRPGDSNQGEWDPQENRSSRDGTVSWNDMIQ